MTPKLPIVFWIVFALAMGVYATMLVWSLPLIATAAGGLPPFDMRPSGYNLAEAQAFLAALPADATQFYNDVQIGKLDLVYPALITASLFLAIGLLGAKRLRIWGWVVALVSMPIAVFDYMENINIRLMLFLGPDNINAEIVERASSRTELKSIFTTVAMSVLLVLLFWWAWDRFRQRNQ